MKSSLRKLEEKLGIFPCLRWKLNKNGRHIADYEGYRALIYKANMFTMPRFGIVIRDASTSKVVKVSPFVGRLEKAKKRAAVFIRNLLK